MNNKVKFIQLLSLACVLGLMIFSIQSCKDDDKPPVVTNDDDNTNPDPLAGKDYLLINGYKLEFINPERGTRTLIAGDTTLRWAGNKPEKSAGDTIIQIVHASTRIPGNYKIVDIGFDEGDAMIYIQLGTLDGRPVIELTGGEYTLQLVNGLWVTIVKNGVGVWEKDNGDIVNYTGIELKATWPN